MTLNLEVFYSFQSPYSYVALEEIYDLQENYDISLLWQPFSAKASGQIIPSGPILPEKLSYLIEDTTRLAEKRGIPLVFPEGWPENEFDPGRVIRGAVIASDLGILMEYNIKVFQQWWGEGKNPNEDAFMNQLCDELDVNLGDFLSKVSSSETRERVKGIFKRGRKLGIFDTPTFLIDKERFFGVDKLPYLKCKLDSMGLKKK